MEKNEESLQNLQNASKWKTIGNPHILGIQKVEETEKGVEILFKESMTKSFPNLGRKMDI